MGKDFKFHFTTSEVPEGRLMTADEAEVMLLRRLEDRGGACPDTLWDLARLYSITGRQQIALQYTQKLISRSDNLETIAEGYVAQGQLLEQISNWQAAIACYERALALRPTEPQYWYLAHNNLGYCLNQLGRYAEAEDYCRAAIEINPSRANAFKNLGLSLQGQGKLAAAARSFVDAVKANASDPRAAQHLQELVARHRAAVEAEIPDIDELLRESQGAVELASRVQEGLQQSKKR